MDDLTGLLNSWPYDPEQAIRIIVAQDGRSVLQVRQPLGIEQYEMDGRPDGERPHGFDTVLEYLQDRLKRYIVENGGDAGFHVTVEEASELQAEGVLYYYRYLILFQLHYYDLVIRDTEHNLHVCDMLERYCENEDARNAVLQFRPYIIRMNAAGRAIATARGELEGNYNRDLDEAVEQIESLDDIDSPAFQFERIRSVNYLRALQRKIGGEAETVESAAGDEGGERGQAEDGGDSESHEPAEDPRERLTRELRHAVEIEDYERAARIRDALRRHPS